MHTFWWWKSILNSMASEWFEFYSISGNEIRSYFSSSRAAHDEYIVVQILPTIPCPKTAIFRRIYQIIFQSLAESSSFSFQNDVSAHISGACEKDTETNQDYYTISYRIMKAVLRLQHIHNIQRPSKVQLIKKRISLTFKRIVITQQ